MCNASDIHPLLGPQETEAAGPTKNQDGDSPLGDPTPGAPGRGGVAPTAGGGGGVGVGGGGGGGGGGAPAHHVPLRPEPELGAAEDPEAAPHGGGPGETQAAGAYRGEGARVHARSVICSISVRERSQFWVWRSKVCEATSMNRSTVRARALCAEGGSQWSIGYLVPLVSTLTVEHGGFSDRG